MALIRPQHVVFYDPSGAANPNQRAVIYYDETLKPDVGGRPNLTVVEGGGFASGSGTVPGSWDPDLGAEVGLWYKAGGAVSFVGYTPHSPALPGQGAFDYQQWAQLPGEVLAIDHANPQAMARPCAERDLLNWCQFAQTHKIGDLTQDPRRTILRAKSAGFIASSFCAFGPMRNDPTALGERFTKPTRWGAVMGRACISSAPAWWHTRVLRHWSNGFGAAANTIGQALNASNLATGFSGLINMRRSSALWTINAPGPAMAEARRLNAFMPVWLENTGVVAWPGPYDYAGMMDCLLTDHPPEAVVSMREALLSLAAEHPGHVHDTRSRFVLTGPGETAPTNEERFSWMVSAIDFGNFIKVL